MNNTVEDGSRKKVKLALGGGCLIVVVVVFAFLAAIGFFIMTMMKSNDPYQHVLEEARKNPEVVAALGEPIKDGWLVSGHVETSGGAGNAQLSGSLSGPKGSAKMYVEARKIAGRWNYDVLVVQPEGGRQIDLRQSPSLAPSPQ